jgi:glycosyltransferase involved in cell wall biosynthesis
LAALEQIIKPEPEHGVEIIVVDNNSGDQTPLVIREAMASTPFKMRYVFEKEQGISAARNRAIDEAKGDYLAFLDDECVVNRDWLMVALSTIGEFRPCFIGGPYFGAFLPGNRPGWFKVEYGNAYFLSYHYERGFQNTFLASSGNMFVRRDVFDAVRFDVAMGPVGNQLKLGEETNLQERYLATHSTEKVFYEPRLIVHHFILPVKLRLSYAVQRAFQAGLSHSGRIGVPKMFSEMVRALVHGILAPFRCIWRDRTKYPFWQNYVYERLIPATVPRVGVFVKCLRGNARGRS